MNERNSKSSLQKRILGSIGIGSVRVKSADRKERSEVICNMILIIGLVIVLAFAGLTATGIAQGNNQPPSNEAIAFANRTSDLMTATLFAALLQEFDETTRDNVEEGKLSIGLMFDDSNTNMRLVGTFDPLSENDYPSDDFEYTALANALEGHPTHDVQRVSGKWYYRRSIPLSNFREECAYCHTNFPSVPNSEDYVGALMLKVPITRD